MISPKLYRSSGVYNLFLRGLGYEHSIDRYLQAVALTLPPDCRILDAGCGTGLMGLHFLERLPAATLLATDLEPNFLQATLSNAARRGIDQQRISVAVGDIAKPTEVRPLHGAARTLAAASFDLICVGAVVGYSQDQEATLRALVSLLSPNGYLVNLEMNEGFLGRWVSRRYHYRGLPIREVVSILREAGCEVTLKPLAMRYFPAKLTRVGIVARRRAENGTPPEQVTGRGSTLMGSDA